MAASSIREPVGLPAEWHAAQLQQVATFHQGGRLKLTKADYEPVGVRAYSAKGQDGYVATIEEARETVVILSSIGARCGKCFLAPAPWTTLANTQVIRPIPGKCEASYLWHYVNNEDYWHRSGSAQPFIKPTTLKQAWVALPPLAEQGKIAAILSSVDEVIERTEAVIEQLQVVKKAMMQELLTRGLPGRHTRFKQTEIGEIPEEWDARPALTLARSISPTAKVKSKAHKISGSIPVVDQGKEFIAGYVDDENAIQQGGLPVIVFGDHTREWKFIDFPFAVGADGTKLLRPISEHDPRFVYHVLCATPLKNLGYSRHFKLLKEAKVPVPPLAEQREIAAAVDSVEFRLSCERKCRLELKATKAALMSVLLTGELRVTPDECTA